MVHRFDRIPVSREERERGATLVLFVCLLTTFMILAGLVIDWGNTRQVRRQAQNSADAAALAGANVLYLSSGTPDFTSALAAVKNAAFIDYGVNKTTGWNNCTDPNALTYKPDGNSNTCISFDSSTAPTKVRVSIPNRSVGLYFGQMIGQSTAAVGADAVAKARVFGGSAPCGLCVLNATAADALYMESNGTVTVTGNSITVLSTSTSALHFKSDGKITTPSTQAACVHGSLKKDSNSTMTPAPRTGCTDTFADPLSTLPTPTWTGNGPDVTSSSAVTLGPGATGVGACTTSPSTGVCVYHNITVGGGNYTFKPGMYIITGTMSLTSGGNAIATGGSTFYFATTGKLTTASSGSVKITSVTPGASCPTQWPACTPYQGVAIYYDRANTLGLSLLSDGGITTTGAIYAKASTLTLKSNGGATTLNSLVIVDKFDNKSDGAMSISYSASQNPTATPTLPVLLQ